MRSLRLNGEHLERVPLCRHLSSGTHQPITAALIALNAGGTSVHQYNVESAAVLIAALPPLLVYFFGGRYFLRGLTQGALK